MSATWKWLKALFLQAPYATWSVASVASTLLTFIPLVPFKFSGLVRPALIIFALASFARANLKLFQSQESEIDDLERDLSLQEERIRALQAELNAYKENVARLTIHPIRGSRYMLHPYASMKHADFVWGYFEFCFRVTNKGNRASSIVNYQIRIEELNVEFADLLPEEDRFGISGRHSSRPFVAQPSLSDAGVLRVEADSTSDQGALLFLIPGLNLEVFTKAGLVMHGEERRFGPLHCRLILTDTNGVSTIADFEMPEE